MNTPHLTEIHDYITAVLMRDLVGHDRKPASFLVYLWLVAEQQRRTAAVSISYQELAESIGISKSSAQSSVGHLIRRKLLAVSKASVTATPQYTVRTPWTR
jgi:predicted transcriptional regulator